MKDEKTESKPLSDEEIEEKTDIVDADIEKLKSLINDLTKARKKKIPTTPNKGNNYQTHINKPIHWKALEGKEKDGTGYGDIHQMNETTENEVPESETYVGLPAEPAKNNSNKQTYIEQNQKNYMVKPDLNKLKNTQIGDEINYFDNGVHGTGVVAKMDSQFITIFKEDGRFYNINVNDTFFVKDILINKTWNDMSIEERTVELQKAHAYSPRFLSKSWDQLPRELREVLQSDQEQGAYGNAGRNPNAGVSTDTPFDATSDYETKTHDSVWNKSFQYEDKKPSTDKDPVKKEADGGTVTSNDDGVYNERHDGKKEDEDKKKAGEFTYSEKPSYKTKSIGVPQQQSTSWGIKYVKKGDKHIKDKEEEE